MRSRQVIGFTVALEFSVRHDLDFCSCLCVDVSSARTSVLGSGEGNRNLGLAPQLVHPDNRALTDSVSKAPDWFVVAASSVCRNHPRPPLNMPS